MDFTNSLAAFEPVGADMGEHAFARWKHHASINGQLPVEFLLPRARRRIQLAEIPFLTGPLRIPVGEFRERAASLAPWTYHVEVPGAFSMREYGTYSDETVVFHRYRSALISATVMDLLGADAPNAAVLDLACNCGVFSLDLAQRGVGRVVGVDLRPENLAQAELLRRAYGIDNVSFRQVNVKELGSETYDVVLNLGLMYHLSTPFEVMRASFEATRRFCVVDTITHKEPFSAYFVNSKDTNIPLEGDLKFELQPTYRGIIATMREAGFSFILEVEGLCDTNITLYSDSSRRCLIGFRDDPRPYLKRLDAPKSALA